MKGSCLPLALCLALLLAAPARGEDWFGDPIITPLPGTPGGLAVGELDGNPGLDAAIGTVEGVIWLMANDGTGHFTQWGTLVSPGASYSVAVGDFNGDGVADIGCSDYQNGPGVRIFIGLGGGAFEEAMVASSEERISVLSSYDLDGDGKDDLLAGCVPRVDVYWGESAGVSAEPLSLPCPFPSYVNSSCKELLAADTDGDPYVDLVYQGSISSEGSQVNVIGRLRGEGGRQFEAIEWLVVDPFVHDYDKWVSGGAGDIDGDDDLDFVVGPRVSPFRTFIKTGPGTWTEGPAGEVPLNETVLDDWDRNGTLDITGVSRYVSSGNGDATFSVMDTTAALGGVMKSLEIDEVPGPDIVCTNSYFNDLRVLSNLVWQDPAEVPSPTLGSGHRRLLVRPSVWSGHGAIRIELRSPSRGVPTPLGRLSVVDPLGRVIEELDWESAGSWDEVLRWTPDSSLPSGAYWIRSASRGSARIVILR